MDGTRQTYVHVAELLLRWDNEAAAPGGAVTEALCGSVDHQPPCRWPHHNAIGSVSRPAHFRTVFVATPDEESEVRALIDRGLHAGTWEVRSTGPGVVQERERELGERLAGSLADPD